MAELQPFQSNDESEYMKLVKQEELLDSLLATPDNSENGAHDRDWLAIATQLEKQLAEESGSIDKETMIRILSKSISAVIKLQINDAIRNDLNLEQIARHRIDDYHYSQTIINDMPALLKSKFAKEAANKRHILTYKQRDAVVTYWLEYIYPEDPKLSNEKAGEWLHDTFDKLSVRKLAKYVGYAKRELKKLPPAA
jgi:hypothetical protein